jgi:DNA topoisomerase-1
LKPNAWPPVVKVEHHKVGAEKNKIRSTPLGKSVSDFLYKEFNDLFNYEFTAGMENSLDQIATANKPWKSLLQETWDTYKDRYEAMRRGTSSGTTTNSTGTNPRERILGPGIKVILSKKGPLFVRDPPEGSPKTAKATFASLTGTMGYDTVSLEDAEQAFQAVAEARQGELLGTEGGIEIRKKKGPYGFYAECGPIRVPLSATEDDLDQIKEKIKAKTASALIPAYERKVGDFTIKRGPYGLYFYKHGLKKIAFVKFPAGLDPEKVNTADLTGLYSDNFKKTKKKFAPKGKVEAKETV